MDFAEQSPKTPLSRCPNSTCGWSDHAFQERFSREMHPLGRAFQHLHLPTSARLQGGFPPWQSLGKQGLEKRTSGHSFLSLLLKYTHSNRHLLLQNQCWGPLLCHWGPWGQGKQRVTLQFLWNASFLCSWLIAFVRPWMEPLLMNGGSYHAYFSTALLLSSHVLNLAKELPCSSALETPSW